MEYLQQFKESLIGIVDQSVTSMVTMKLSRTINPNTNIVNIEVISNTSATNIFNLLPDKDAFTIRRITGNLIELTRHRSTYCGVCQRTHDNENPYLTISGYNKAVYFNCRRSNGERSLLGILGDAQETEDNLGEIENIISLYQLDNIETISDNTNAESSETNNPGINVSTIDNISKERCLLRINDPNTHHPFEVQHFGYAPSKANIVYSEQYMRPIEVKPFQILLRQGYLGKGKTRSFIEWIKNNNPRRILYLSSRQMFARSITAELNRHLPDNQFTCYLNVTDKHSLVYYDRLVIQMESLIHLDWAGKENEVFMNELGMMYDVIILDEVESLLKQFSSDKTMKGRLYHCAVIFERLLLTTPYVIGADAFLTTRSRRVLRQLNPKIVIERNLHPPVKRQCLQYENKYDFISAAKNALSAGKNIVMVWGSKDAMLRFEHTYLKRNGYSYKMYHGTSTDNVRNDLSIVNRTWSEVQVVMYTASITVGVSFDKLHFDELFVYGSCMSMSVRDLFQAMMRVRHLTNNVMHCYLQTIYCRYDAPELTIGEKYILEQLRQKVSDLDQFMREYSLKDLWEVMPIWLSMAHVLNKKEDAYTALHYQRTFDTYLLLCNYDKQIIRSSKLKLDEIQLPRLDYHQVREITGNEKRVIEKQIKEGTAGEIERLELDKYIFDHLLITDLPSEVRQVLYNESWINGKRHKFLNSYRMVNGTIKGEFDRELDNHFKECSSMRSVRMGMIDKFASILDLENVGQGKTWNHEERMNHANQIMPEFDKYARWANLKTKIRRTNTKGLIKALLNKAYEPFTESKFVDIRHRPRINGKRVDQSYLIKTPCYIMPCINGGPSNRAPKTADETRKLMEMSKGISINLTEPNKPPDKAKLVFNTNGTLNQARLIINQS